MKLPAVLLAHLSPLLLVSQQPFPTWSEEPEWNVLECIYGIGVYCHTETYAFSGSQTMCGQDWSVLSLQWDTAYFRNDGSRTLFRRSTDCQEKEYLIYDHSLAVGDTVYVGLNMDWSLADTAMFRVEEIDTVLINNVERRRSLMKFDRCNEGNLDAPSYMHWIEGVGSTMHPFYPFACICDFCESGYVLLCHEVSSEQLYFDTLYASCDTIISTVSVPEPSHEAGEFVIGVDGSHTVTLNYPSLFREGRLRMIDSAGRALFSKRVTNSDRTLNVAELPSGVYLTELIDRGGKAWCARWIKDQ